MDPQVAWALTALFLILAVLYSSVGQGGGSGYLAAMALLGVAPENIRQTALTLNVVVAAIGLVKFARAGFFDGRLCLPFILASVPAAFLGGVLTLPAEVFKPVVAVILLWAAALLLWRPPPPMDQPVKTPPLLASLGAGGAIGVLSGLIGIGGGIFLAPLLILMGWANPKVTAALTSAFILANSLAALVGVLSHSRAFPVLLPVWMGVVALGGWIGADVGAKRLSPGTLQRLLAGILALVSLKIFLAG
ncbi:MAG: sulfite exporter TauE/SafE family protein [Gemmatimonadota bacterium]|jgi:uncharacterized membrane protein YfcA